MAKLIEAHSFVIRDVIVSYNSFGDHVLVDWEDINDLIGEIKKNTNKPQIYSGLDTNPNN